MPNYIVELPESQTYSQLGEGATKMVIFAADEAGARRAAAGRFDGDGNALWNTEAVVTELVAGAALADAGDVDGWEAYVRISGGAAQVDDPLVFSVNGLTRDDSKGILGNNRLHVGAVALNDGGVATYVIDDILTAAGGTFTRAATFRVITVSTGVITAVELVDPGEYSVLPATMTANPVTGGGGTAALLDLTAAAPGSYEALLGQLTTELAASVELTASLDLSEGASGTRLLTMATVGDGIGDATAEVEIRHNSTVETVLMSTITDGGSAAAVLTAAIPASPIAPPRIHVFGSHGD
jgi:hypothetical protein